MSPMSSEAQAQVGQGQRLPSTPLSCTPTDRGLAVCERRSVCVCAQLCLCVYCVKERCTPTPAMAEVSGNPPPNLRKPPSSCLAVPARVGGGQSGNMVTGVGKNLLDTLFPRLYHEAEGPTAL